MDVILALRSAIRFSSRTIRCTVAVFPVPGTPDMSKTVNFVCIRINRHELTYRHNLHFLHPVNLLQHGGLYCIPLHDKVARPDGTLRVVLA